MADALPFNISPADFDRDECYPLYGGFAHFISCCSATVSTIELFGTWCLAYSMWDDKKDAATGILAICTSEEAAVRAGAVVFDRMKEHGMSVRGVDEP